MAKQSPPFDWNFGGVWVFNPPEPQAHTTRLHGFSEWSFAVPAGNCPSIPGAWTIDLGVGVGENEIFDALFGRHVLRLRHGSFFVPPAAVRTYLGFWSTDQLGIDDDELFGMQIVPWTLFYGALTIDVGPYFISEDEQFFPETFEWYLISLGGPDGGAWDVYQMWNPEADPKAVSRDTFDCLRPNVFRYVVPHDGGEPTTGMQNEFVTVRPYYP